MPAAAEIVRTSPTAGHAGERSSLALTTSNVARSVDAAADRLLAGKAVATAAFGCRIGGLAGSPAGSIRRVAGGDVDAAIVPRAGCFAGAAAGVFAGLYGGVLRFVLRRLSSRIADGDVCSALHPVE